LDSKIPYLSPLRSEALPSNTPAQPRSRGLDAPSRAATEPAPQPRDSAQTNTSAAEEAKELDLWRKRYQPQLGLVTTPPTGEVAEKEQFAKAYVQELVQQLAGDEIKQKDIDLRVELFSGDLPQVGLDDSSAREIEWEKQHPGQEWPIRTLLEAPAGNKPLYRLVVTEGMLNHLETREELAFVLAAQLEKLFKHHAQDPNNEQTLSVKSQTLLDSREQQIANDSAAIARMCKSNLNPQGALSGVAKLYKEFGPKYAGDDQRVALAAAAQVQEHEGVRISMLQAQVEQLRRSGEPASLQQTELLPKDNFPLATGNYQSRLANFEAFQNSINNAADQLSGSETPSWMFEAQGRPSPVELLKALKPSPQDFEQSLLGVCEHLQNSDKSPQQKVDGFLRLVLAFNGDNLSTAISTESQKKVQDFLTSNLGDQSANGWKPDQLLNSLSQPSGRSLHRNFTSKVLQNEAFQTLVGPLATNSKSLQGLAGSAAENYCRKPENGQVDLDALSIFLNSNNSFPNGNWPLAGLQNQGALQVLAKQDPQQLAQTIDESGLPEGLVLCNDLRNVDDITPEFANQLRSAMEPIQTASNAVREDNARLRLRPPLTQPITLSSYMQELFASEAGQPFSPEFEAQLPALLKDVVLSCNHQTDLIFDSGRPRELETGLERRLCEMLKTGDGETKEEVMKFMSRHWAHELRVPTHSERREWTIEAAKHLASKPIDDLVFELTAPETGQFNELLRKSLMDGFGLADEALPNVSSESLQALNERRQAGEFKPKPENYASKEDYKKAEQAYQLRCDALKSSGRFFSSVDSRLTLSKLAILGHRERKDYSANNGGTGSGYLEEQRARLQEQEQALDVASKLSPEQWVNILEATEKTLERSKLVRSVSTDVAVDVLGSDAATFIMDGFMAVESKIPELDRFYEMAKRTVALNPLSIESRGDTKGRFAQSMFDRLQKLETPQLREWLGKDFVLDVLKPEQTSQLVQQLLGDKVGPQTPPAELGQLVDELDKTFRLKKDHGLAFTLLRDDITEKAKLQPNTLNQVFPPDSDNPISQIGSFKGQIAGLSGLVAMTRAHSPQDQLATLEYLMGRSSEMPKFLEDATESQNLGPVAQTLRNARQALSDSEFVVRTIVANSFLAGPTGLLNAEGGKDAVMNFVLQGVEPKYLKMAKPMIQAVLFSQGDAESLAVAMVLGSKPKKTGDPKLTEADILNKVFDSYGVPGVKMKQYLAFTSQFDHFREAFESAQDAANPLNYYETLRLIQNRFADEWPNDLQVDRVLGSGSVNVAIRYFDTTKQKREVVSLGREDIAEATRYDFERFNKFIDALTSNPDGKANFGFIRGLTGIIQDSVKLEFDKEAAKAIQHQAYETYKHKFDDGWTVKSIDAHTVKHLGLFMEEAKGKTARKTLGANPALYKEAMRHMAAVEFKLLKGQDATENTKPKPNFANPDFHDGQVMIDEKEKTITILDFGQAVPISNEQREGALDLLTVLGKLDTTKQGLKRLNKRYFPNSKETGVGLTAEDLKSIWKSDSNIPQPKGGNTKKMDAFIRLLAVISQKGGKVPLSAVHWVLALNRQFVLGDKLDQSIKAEVVGMVVNHKVGLPLGVYNTVHDTTDKAIQWTGNVAHCLGAWAFPSHFAAKPEAETIKAQSAGQYSDIIDMLQAEGPTAQPPLEPTKQLWGGSKSSFAWYPDELISGS
jgi:hypothetical protein